MWANLRDRKHWEDSGADQIQETTIGVFWTSRSPGCSKQQSVHTPTTARKWAKIPPCQPTPTSRRDGKETTNRRPIQFTLRDLLLSMFLIGAGLAAFRGSMKQHFRTAGRHCRPAPACIGAAIGGPLTGRGAGRSANRNPICCGVDLCHFLPVFYKATYAILNPRSILGDARGGDGAGVVDRSLGNGSGAVSLNREAPSSTALIDDLRLIESLKRRRNGYFLLTNGRGPITRSNDNPPPRRKPTCSAALENDVGNCSTPRRSSFSRHRLVHDRADPFHREPMPSLEAARTWTPTSTA